ncbi:hypothetical protein [Idiomarina sp. HP20-50]|uniref:hypothetical protein n=1 Tax=Idiomarina sp. HP20-50 TaxID=3070813 RepID=UPI00294B7956|nr:hypothetical protein [Idiomarina sp. HP20-50]MDV6316254.1 hypothetical protein [Idiomarina sp. HP20-50]
MKKFSSEQQLNLFLEFENNSRPLEQMCAQGNKSKQNNVVDFRSEVNKKDNSEMSIFRKRVLDNVTSYFNL